eukprot:jgi/Chrzof1/12853/Cz07g09210.t1
MLSGGLSSPYWFHKRQLHCRGANAPATQASQHAPSIIFLDELDALVPSRSVRAGTTDQIYASVVSTLLALMDGVTDRGQVVVIGATNRYIVGYWLPPFLIPLNFPCPIETVQRCRCYVGHQ